MTYGKEKAILIDLDGTVCEKHDGRNFFEWDKVDKDLENVNVAAVVKALPKEWKKIFVSGRDASCFGLSLAWLVEHGFHVDQLLMRPEGDMRDDTIVKKEIYDNFIRDKYEVIGVFDDRAKVVRMWRSLGLTVFQVAEGNY